MNHVAIVREGDGENEIPTLISRLRDIRPDFVKQGRIVFVGICTVRSGKDVTVLYCLPKYFPKDKCKPEYLNEIKTHLMLLCKVIERLRSKGKSFDDSGFLFDPYQRKAHPKHVNRAELAEFIIEDYLQNGLYVKDQTAYGKSGAGRTSWAKTVAKCTPIIRDDSAIFADRMNKRHIIDDNDIISIIHATVLNQCLDFLGPLISEGITPVETEPLGSDLTMYTGTIRARSAFIFREREIELFKAIEAWCGLTGHYRAIAGTTSFDRVWEWVNDAVWGNKDAVKSSNPVYHLGGKEYEGSGESKPDTIRTTFSKELFIFDSKYYTVTKISRNGLVGYPANSDIAKQVGYLKLLKSHLQPKAVYNTLLLPECSDGLENGHKESFLVSADSWFEIKGYVEPGSFAGKLGKEFAPTVGNGKTDCDNKVLVALEKPDELYRMFLYSSRAEDKDLERIRTEWIKLAEVQTHDQQNEAML